MNGPARPLPVSASCWQRGVLSLRLSGADAAVLAALHKLGGAQSSTARRTGTALRDQTHEYFSGGDKRRSVAFVAATGRQHR